MAEIKHIDITELTEDTIRFTLSGVDSSVANTLRRAMIAEVPSVAIRTVSFKENTSVLTDDYIAHRLGLIPLRRVSDDINTEINQVRLCNCNAGCDKCTVTLSLDVTCYGNEPINVTSKDLHSSNPNYAPAHYTSQEEERVLDGRGIRIVTLAPGQRLCVECKAVLGVGKEHTKWSPVGTAVFRYVPIVHINKDQFDTKDIEFKQRFVAICPKRVFSIDAQTNTVFIRNSHDCMFCGDCESFNESYADKVVTISQKPDVFEFTVESIGSVRPLEILKLAINALKEKLRVVKDSIEDPMFMS